MSPWYWQLRHSRLPPVFGRGGVTVFLMMHRWSGAAQVRERSFRAQPLGIVAGSDEQRACAVGPDAGQLDERRRGRRDQGRSYALHDACRANPPCKRAVSARLRR
jgi:hypothetical protein